MSMPKAWDVYTRALEVGRSFLKSSDLPDDKTAKALLDLSPEDFQAYARSLGMGSTKHVHYTVLAVASYPQPLKELLRQGARFSEVQRLHALLPNGKRKYRRKKQATISLEELERAVADGSWRMLISKKPRPIRSEEPKPVWLFPADLKTRQKEGLNLVIAELLVELYSQPGELVVDPMAGKGTVVQVARRIGRKAWGSDIAGDGELVKVLDVRNLVRVLGQEKADLLVLHPPTFETWERRNWWPSTKDAYSVKSYVDPYLDYLDYLVEGVLKPAVPVLKPRGYLALIAKPRQHRPTGTTAPFKRIFVAPLERAIAEFPGHYVQTEQGEETHPVLLPHAYHLAVSDNGDEHWAIFVAQKAVNPPGRAAPPKSARSKNLLPTK